MLQIATALKRWGFGPAGGFASLAARVPRRTAIVDDAGSLTFASCTPRPTRWPGRLPSAASPRVMLLLTAD